MPRLSNRKRPGRIGETQSLMERTLAPKFFAMATVASSLYISQTTIIGPKVHGSQGLRQVILLIEHMNHNRDRNQRGHDSIPADSYRSAGLVDSSESLICSVSVCRPVVVNGAIGVTSCEPAASSSTVAGRREQKDRTMDRK